MVLFVLTPAEILGLPPDVRLDRLGKAIELATLAGAQIALFSAPFVFVSVIIGELLGKRSWLYYTLTGMLVSALGLFAQQTTEHIGQPTIANNYALTAFLVSGFVSGLVYWMTAGRLAGGGARNNASRETGNERTELAIDTAEGPRSGQA